MGETISVRLEKSDLADLKEISKGWKIARSEMIRRLLAQAMKEVKIQNALKELQEHKISIGMAAKKCDLNLWEMMDLVKQHKIDWTGYGKEDLQKDLAILEGK